jgi:hypothetical protein
MPDMTIEDGPVKNNKIEFKVDMVLTNEEQTLLSLADDMAAAMSNLNSQNYKEFIDARDKFRSVISELVNKQRKTEARIAKMKEAILAA